MATLIDNAAAVKAASQAIDAAIAAKGGSTAGGLRNAAAAIASLPSGGEETPLVATRNGTYNAPEGKAYNPVKVEVYPYKPEPDVPQIDDILASDEIQALIGDYTYTCIACYNNGITSTTVQNAQAYIHSDDPTHIAFEGTGSHTITWQNTDAKHWVVMASNTQFNWASTMNNGLVWLHCGRMSFTTAAFTRTATLVAVTGSLDISQCTKTTDMFSYCPLLTVVPDVLDTSASTECYFMFASCPSLKRVPAALDLSNCKNAPRMFFECSSLTELPSVLDLSKITQSAQLFFSSCTSLLMPPDVVDFSNCSSSSDAIRNLNSLRALPTHFSGSNYASAIAYDFSSSPNIAPESFATFDSAGNLVGGMTYYLNDVNNSFGTEGAPLARTLNLPSVLRAQFTAAERATIIAHVNALGWTLGNFAP